MPVIQLQTLIHAPAEVCFNLSRNIDVHLQSMQHSRERAISGTVSGLMGLNDQVTWQAWHFGWPFQLTVYMAELQFAQYFVDEMLSGPFRWMRHYHQFKPQYNGTLMVDEFAFQSPLGWLGKLANRLFLKQYLHSLLSCRNQYIKQLAEQPSLNL